MFSNLPNAFFFQIQHVPPYHQPHHPHHEEHQPILQHTIYHEENPLDNPQQQQQEQIPPTKRKYV